MIFQVFLTVLLVGVVIYGAAQWQAARLVSLAALGTAATAIYFTWVPNHANVIAAHMGPTWFVEPQTCNLLTCRAQAPSDQETTHGETRLVGITFRRRRIVGHAGPGASG